MENNKKKDKGLEAIIWAKAFYNSFIVVEQVRPECPLEIMIDIPLMVNGCFSIELSLKAMLINKGIKYGKDHNIVLLFLLLPESLQCEVLDHLYEKAPEYKRENKVVDELLLIANAFSHWRYGFEGDEIPAIDLQMLLYGHC